MEAFCFMRLYALIVLCFTVAFLSGISLFWSMTKKSNELWLDLVFVLALVLALFFLLSVIKRIAGQSVTSIVLLRNRDDSDGNDRHLQS